MRDESLLVEIRDLYYALAKQLPTDADSLTIHSSYGEFTLTGDTARLAAGALHDIMIEELERLEEQLQQQRKEGTHA